MKIQPNNSIESATGRQAWRVKEFCEAFRISNSTFWKQVSIGEIRIIRIGGRVLVPAVEAARIVSEGGTQ